MKKILLTTAICLIGAASMMAQGRIAFANTSQNRLMVQNDTINGGVPVVLGTASTALFGFGPASMQIRLFAGLTSTSLSPVLIGTAADQQFVLNTTSGLAAAQGTFAGGNPLPLAGFDGSAPVYLQFTATGVGAATGYSATSTIILVNLATGAAPSTAVFGPTASGSLWNGIGNIVLVPEPSSMALAGLGAASLLLFRRRK
jgi:hypothetical protein